MDLYSLFIELATKLIKPRAVSSYIVPDSLIGRSNFSETRYEIICKRTILDWVHINEVCESANVASIIYVFRNEPRDEYTFDYVKAENVKQWQSSKASILTIRKSIVEKTEAHKVNFTSDAENLLLFKINENERLSSTLIMWRGEEMGRRSSAISSEKHNNSKSLLAGDNVHRYKPVTCSRYINDDNVCKGNYEKPKILIRQLGTCINATLDLDGSITLQSIYNLALEDDNVECLKFILGLLNSKLYDFLYKKTAGDKQTFQRIILENIKQLPLPKSSEIEQRTIAQYVDKILSAKQENPQADTANLESEIDQLVYRLYGLSEEEIKIVEGGS